MKRSHPLSRSSSLWNIVFLLTMLVYAAGLFVDIMEPDAAVYAEVSMEMHDTGNYLSIYHKQLDWLDKPHFPFWMSAISYDIFGVSSFAYKLPAVLFILLGAAYTFLFARRYYSPLHGWVASLMLMTAQHIIISNQDVRAEPFMTGLVIMALYHLAVFVENRRDRNGLLAWPHAVFGALALACLMMTKGLFTIIPVGAGIGLTLIYTRQWRRIFDWAWLAIVIVVAVFLFPALYGYYLQFDLHPEKEIFGRHGVSGVGFFLWTSQWGRFTNTGPIKGSGDPSFFVHTLLWAFLPWSFAAFYGLFRKTKALIKKTGGGEHYTYFGFVTLFLIFSASKFQLSFYLNPLFPLLAIITTAALLQYGIRPVKVFARIHTVLAVLLLLALGLLHYFFLADIPHIDTIIVVLLCAAMSLYLFFRRTAYLKKILFAMALMVLGVNYYLNRDFYPALLQYQAESQAAHFIRNNRIPVEQVVFVGDVQSVADIILHHITPIVAPDSVSVGALAGRYVFTSPEGQKKIDSLGLKYSVIMQFEDFPVTRLTGKFINRKTRAQEVRTQRLLKTADGVSLVPSVDAALR